MKFNIFDKVRPKGEKREGTIVKVDNSIAFPYLVNFGNAMYASFKEDDLELCEKAINCKFSVGDKVITKKDHDECGSKVFPVGTVGRVVEVVNHRACTLPYCVKADDDSWWYSEDMIEAYEPFEEKKEEVKKTETRYNPNKADAMIGNVGEQIKVAYGWGYKDGNFDGYQRGVEEEKLTKEKAIDFLRECGWLAEHDREITEGKFKDGYEVAMEELGDDYDRAMDEKYMEGYEAAEAKYKKSYDQESYDQGRAYGLGEAWGIARKAEQILFDGDQFKKCFGDTDFHTVLNTMQASEVAQKIKEYEAKRILDDIYIGDEVVIHRDDGDDVKAVVLGSTIDGKLWLLTDRGVASEHELSDKEILVKTEKSYFEGLQDILENLRED